MAADATTMKVRAGALATMAVVGSAAGGLRAQAPMSGAFDYRGAGWERAMQAEEAQAASMAGLLRQAHERTTSALLAARDTDLLEHMRRDGRLPEADSGFSAHSAAERSRLAGIGIETRVCGRRLVSYIRPDADGRVGRTTGAHVALVGGLDRIGADGGIRARGRSDPTDPEVAACGLPPGAPAIAGPWRAPAAERSTALSAELRHLDCPDGEVGSGIVQRREIRTVTDGHGAAVAAESGPGPWLETGRSCRTPRTGTLAMPLPCTRSEGALAGTGGVRMSEWDWTEARNPNDARDVVRVFDWANPRTLYDLCGAGGAEEVTVDTVLTVGTQERSCAAVHGPTFRARGSSDRKAATVVWPLGGPVGEEREIRTSTVTFPATWARPAKTIVSHDPWHRVADDCRARVTRHTGGSKTTGGCPAGCPGQGSSEGWDLTVTELQYAAPLPWQSTRVLSSHRSNFVSYASDCRCPTPKSGGGGGGGGSNESKAWRDKVTGQWYDRAPPGSTIHDGSTYEHSGSTKSVTQWESDRTNHGKNG